MSPLIKIYVSIFFFFAFSHSACADNSAHIRLTGNIVTPTCTIDAGKKFKNVSLGTWATRSVSVKGSVTDPVPFSVLLSDCSGDVTKVTVSFSGTSSDTDTGLLRLDDGNNQKKIAVELLTENGQRINLGQQVSMNFNRGMDSYSLDFKARFLSLGGDPVAGNVSSHAILNVSYD